MDFFNLTKYKTELDFFSEISNDYHPFGLLNNPAVANRYKEKLTLLYLNAEKLYTELSDDIVIFINQYKELIDLISRLNNKLKEIYWKVMSGLSNNNFKMVLKGVINSINDKYFYTITNQLSKKTQIPLLINKFVRSIEEYIQLVRIFLDKLIDFYGQRTMQSFTAFSIINEYILEIETCKLNLVSQFKQLSKNRRKCDYAFYIGKNSLSKVNKDISKSKMLKPITLSFS